MKQNYHIDNVAFDQEKGLISFTDQYTQQEEIISLAECIELLLYLRDREHDLRRCVNVFEPRETYSAMRLVDGYWLGCTKERALARVSDAAFQAMLISEERRVRGNWLFDALDKWKRKDEAARLIDYRPGDNRGIPVKVERPPEPTLEDAPMFLAQEAQNKLYNPAFWVNRPENLSLGQFAKVR